MPRAAKKRLYSSFRRCQECLLPSSPETDPVPISILCDAFSNSCETTTAPSQPPSSFGPLPDSSLVVPLDEFMFSRIPDSDINSFSLSIVSLIGSVTSISDVRSSCESLQHQFFKFKSPIMNVPITSWIQDCAELIHTLQLRVALTQNVSELKQTFASQTGPISQLKVLECCQYSRQKENKFQLRKAEGKRAVKLRGSSEPIQDEPRAKRGRSRTAEVPKSEEAPKKKRGRKPKRKLSEASAETLDSETFVEVFAPPELADVMGPIQEISQSDSMESSLDTKVEVELDGSLDGTAVDGLPEEEEATEGFEDDFIFNTGKGPVSSIDMCLIDVVYDDASPPSQNSLIAVAKDKIGAQQFGQIQIWMCGRSIHESLYVKYCGTLLSEDGSCCKLKWISRFGVSQINLQDFSRNKESHSSASSSSCGILCCITNSGNVVVYAVPSSILINSRPKLFNADQSLNHSDHDSLNLSKASKLSVLLTTSIFLKPLWQYRSLNLDLALSMDVSCCPFSLPSSHPQHPAQRGFKLAVGTARGNLLVWNFRATVSSTHDTTDGLPENFTSPPLGPVNSSIRPMALPVSSDAITALGFIPSEANNLIAVATRNGRVSVLDLNSPLSPAMAEVDYQNRAITDLYWSPAVRLVVLSQITGICWNLAALESTTQVVPQLKTTSKVVSEENPSWSCCAVADTVVFGFHDGTLILGSGYEVDKKRSHRRWVVASALMDSPISSALTPIVDVIDVKKELSRDEDKRVPTIFNSSGVNDVQLSTLSSDINTIPVGSSGEDNKFPDVSRRALLATAIREQDRAYQNLLKRGVCFSHLSWLELGEFQAVKRQSDLSFKKKQREEAIDTGSLLDSGDDITDLLAIKAIAAIEGQYTNACAILYGTQAGLCVLTTSPLSW